MAPTSHVAEELLKDFHPPKAAATIFTEKILHKPLHLQPASQDPNSQDARAHRRIVRFRKEQDIKRRRKVRPLSAKENRISGAHDIAPQNRKYEIYEPLHHMWLQYMREVLGLEESKPAFISAQTKGSFLASADYHGALVSVTRARCASLVGLVGIVVKDTKFTFQLITKKNELKIIPKRYTLFRIEIPQTASIGGDEHSDLQLGPDDPNIQSPVIFEIHGSQFESRATDRSTKKFKQRYLKHI